jgi:D-psicose/D-tagatose/L-ribulose 3-epimerase
MTFGINTTVAQAQALADAGYDYFELGVKDALVPASDDREFAVKRAAIQALGVPVPVFAGFLPSTLRVVGDDVPQERLEHHVATVCRRAQACGARVIVFGSSGSRNVARGGSTEKALEQIAAFLMMAADHAEAHDLVIALEPLCRLEGNVIRTIPDALAILRRVDRKGVGLVADFYHMWQEGEPLSVIAEAADRLVHVHIAEPTTRVAPGRTPFDFGPFFDALHEAGYDGRVSCECRLQDLDRDGRGALQTMRSYAAG